MTKVLTKFCGGCNLTLSTDDFYDHPSTADGLATRCKTCARKCTAASQERARLARLEVEAEKALPPGLPIETYIDRHAERRAREAEIEVKLKEKEQEESFRFETQKTFSPRWRVA